MQRPGFVPPRPLPHVPPAGNNYGRPYAPFPPGPPGPPRPGYPPHQQTPPIPVHVSNNNIPRPYPIPQNNPYPPSQPPITSTNGNMPYGTPPPMGPGFNPMLATGTPAFRPSTQYTGSSPQGQHIPMPNASQPYPPIRQPVSQYPPPGGVRPGPGGMPSCMPIPHPHHHPSPVHGQRPPMQPLGGNLSRPPPGSLSQPKVTPLMQYNYSLGGSFPWALLLLLLLLCAKVIHNKKHNNHSIFYFFVVRCLVWIAYSVQYRWFGNLQIRSAPLSTVVGLPKS